VADPLVGEIRLFAGTVAPPGWLPCDGRTLPIEPHMRLFTVLGTTYGGDGRLTFALPDFRNRVPLGSGYDPTGTPQGWIDPIHLNQSAIDKSGKGPYAVGGALCVTYIIYGA